MKHIWFFAFAQTLSDSFVFSLNSQLPKLYLSSTTTALNMSGKSLLPSPVVENSRWIPSSSTTDLLFTIATLPLWAVTVLPLSIFYQIGRNVLTPLLPKSEKPTIDSGYVVKTEDIIPSKKRKYDLVILGASGFTGQLAARHLAKTYGVNKSVKWAVAGRSQSKLNQMKKELAAETGIPEVNDVDTIICDTSIPATLPKLVAQCRCLVTTTGPYSLYGNAVVEFCVKFSTHYVDITGEVEWVKAMIQQWQSKAQETGAILVPFCGHDSIPWDLSVQNMEKVLNEECNDYLESVTFWDETAGEPPGGTIATIFAGVEGKIGSAKGATFDPFLKLPDGTESEHKCTPDLPMWIKKSTSPWDQDSESSRWTTPFLMAGVNSEVVGWSHALRSKGSKTLVYREMRVNKDFNAAFVSHAQLLMFFSALLNPVTGTLLKKYVLPKPGDGPSLSNMEDKHYLCVFGEGIGKKGNRVETVMYIPKDAGCLETSRMLVESGICLAQQEKNLPVKQGGFWSPSVALGDTLMERLLKTGTSMETRVIPAGQVISN